MEDDEYERRNSTVFPHNLTIEDCQAAIKGALGFKETRVDQFVFFNYFFSTKDSFPTYLKKSHKDSFHYKVRRECRGIVFDSTTGKVVSRRFQKFFNINEHEESKEATIDITKPHIVLEKLDGSLVAPYLIDGKVSFGTKSGMTDTAKNIERKFLKSAEADYVGFCQKWLDLEYSPMFEWCALSNQIVVKYMEDSLVLIALRNNITGEYLSYTDMVDAASKFNVPVVKCISIENSGDKLQDILKFAKGVTNAEGFVLRFDDGTMYKVKSDWYVERHHRQSTAFGDAGSWHEKNVWTYALDKTLDDILAKMEEGERTARARKFEVDLWAGLVSSAQKITSEVAEYKEAKLSKKEFFAKVNSREDLSMPQKNVYTKLFDGEVSEDVCLQEIVKVVKKLALKNTTLDSARCFAPGVSFEW